MHKSELLAEFLGSDGSVRLTNSRRFKSLSPLLRQLTQDCPERFTDPERLSVLHLGYIPTCKVCSGPSKMKRKQVWQEYCSTQCLHKDPDFRQKVSITHKNRINDHSYEKTKQTCLERYGVKKPFSIRGSQGKD